MDPRLLDGKAVAARLYEETKAEFAALDGAKGKLVSISIGGDKEVAVYIRNQVRGAERAGIPFDEQYWDGNLTQEECKARIVAMNDDPDVTGIILQRPVPEHINVRSLQSAIHPLKDVEGMNPASIGNIVYNDLALSPCTAAASDADGGRGDGYCLPSHDAVRCGAFKTRRCGVGGGWHSTISQGGYGKTRCGCH